MSVVDFGYRDDVTTGAEALARAKASREKFFPAQKQQIATYKDLLLKIERLEIELADKRDRIQQLEGIVQSHRLELANARRRLPAEEISAANLKMENIIMTVATYYGVTVKDIKGRDRNKAPQRQVAMYLCRRLTSHSLPDIGHWFRRDHTTVMFGARRVEAQLQWDPVLCQQIIDLQDKLK
jgi:chromosomal replication initiation ATPase DnaA